MPNRCGSTCVCAYGTLRPCLTCVKELCNNGCLLVVQFARAVCSHDWRSSCDMPRLSSRHQRLPTYPQYRRASTAYWRRQRPSNGKLWQWRQASSSSSTKLFVFILFPLLCGVNDIRLHVARSYTSSPDNPFSLISPSLCQLSSLRPSSLPSPLYFNFHRPPSYLMLLSSQHMPILLQPPFLNFLCDFPNFRCLPYSFISYVVITVHLVELHPIQVLFILLLSFTWNDLIIFHNILV